MNRKTENQEGIDPKTQDQLPASDEPENLVGQPSEAERGSGDSEVVSDVPQSPDLSNIVR